MVRDVAQGGREARVPLMGHGDFVSKGRAGRSLRFAPMAALRDGDETATAVMARVAGVLR